MKFDTKQRYNSIQGLRSFKNTLPTKIKKIISKKGEIYSKTLDNWKYLVGKDLFNICYPKSYKKSNFKGKSLNIMVKHGHEVDVEYSKKQIIDKINYYFGYDVVNDIRIKTFDGVSFSKDKNQLIVKRNSESKEHKAKHGLYRSLINNMIFGYLRH